MPDEEDRPGSEYGAEDGADESEDVADELKDGAENCADHGVPPPDCVSLASVCEGTTPDLSSAVARDTASASDCGQ